MLFSQRFVAVCFCFLLSLAICGCKGEEDNPEALPPVSESDLGNLVKIRLSSSAFPNGGPIGKKYAGEGPSPPLFFPAAPQGTKTWALICDDPDAPSPLNPGPQPWVHWVIYNIPAETTELPEGIPGDAQLSTPSGACQGRNSWPTENVGYRAPDPPPGSGPHRYFFKLYALDCRLELPAAEADKQALLQAMKGHILAKGELIATHLVEE